MNFELKLITFFQIAFSFLIYLFLIFYPDSDFTRSNNMQYLMAFRGLIFLYFSALSPVLLSYKSSSIIPFPINEECIKTLEMALLMPTSANYFYEYLETLCNSERSKDALVYFGLYADIRGYLRMVEEKADQETLKQSAKQIVRDYMGEGR
jgi:hypothetical protein